MTYFFISFFSHAVRQYRYLSSILCVVLALTAIGYTYDADAVSQSGIAAIVGERGVITTSDVEDRIGLSELSAGAPIDEQARKRLYPQILSVLIDEQILRQEADKLALSVNPMDLVKAISALEKQNKLPPGQLRTTLKAAGVPYRSLERKLESQLLRSALLRNEVNPRISVSSAEVEEQMDNIVSKRGYYEVKLSEIVLPITGTAGQAETLAAAEQLITRIENGVSFRKIAEEFSRGPSAAEGGKLAWTGVEKLHASVRSAVEQMDIGQITNPLMVKNAYHIIRLNDKRAMLLNDDDETEIGLRRIFLPLDSDEPALINRTAGILADARSQYNGSCRDFDALAQSVGSTISPGMSMIQVKSLDKKLLPLLSNMPLGELSPVTKGESGMNLFMICERTKARPTPAARQKIKELLTKKKIFTASENYMRGLRARTYVELK